MTCLSSFKSEEVLDENGNKAYYYDVTGTRSKEEDERIKKKSILKKWRFKMSENGRHGIMVKIEKADGRNAIRINGQMKNIIKDLEF